MASNHAADFKIGFFVPGSVLTPMGQDSLRLESSQRLLFLRKVKPPGEALTERPSFWHRICGLLD
jgi:hypothetical protein